MNKNFIAYFTLSLTLIILTLFAVQEYFLASSLINKTRENFIESKESVSSLIVESIRKNILIGDINEAYRQLQIYRSRGLLDEFEIIQRGKTIEASGILTGKNNLIINSRPIHFSSHYNDRNQNNIWGHINIYYSKTPLINLIESTTSKLFFNIIFALLILLSILCGILYFFRTAFLSITPIIEKCISNTSLPAVPRLIDWVWSPLLAMLKKSTEINFKLREEVESEKRLALIGKLTAQVSHDIRSPLAALNMAVRDISSIPEEKRIIIRGSINRIQDIANDLLAKNREVKKNNKIGPITQIEEQPSPQLIPTLLEGIVTEKRMQYRAKLGVQIELDQDKTSYGLFSNIQAQEFNRLISNLVNNSIEAFDDSGKVEISLFGHDDKVEIRIQDNGKGIPSDILTRLGQEGESFGKRDGNGLGLFHAKKTIESWNGTLSIESEILKGTMITILIPRVEAPSWFVPSLVLPANSNIVILDDDSTIHQIWDERFEEKKLKNFGINVFHFSTPDQVIDWLDGQDNASESIYLFDYELIGQNLNGIDLIEKANLSEKAILVTSRFEEKGILERCKSLGIKLIPKSMAASVPISIDQISKMTDSDSTSSSVPCALYDKVYIDDDMFLRWGWQNSAKEKGIKLLTLSSTKEFEKYSSQVSKNATFYIDRELGENEPKGEVWAKELFEMGYRNLYLATGYEEDYFPPMDWLAGIIEKDPPWERNNII